MFSSLKLQNIRNWTQWVWMPCILASNMQTMDADSCISLVGHSPIYMLAFPPCLLRDKSLLQGYS